MESTGIRTLGIAIATLAVACSPLVGALSPASADTTSTASGTSSTSTTDPGSTGAAPTSPSATGHARGCTGVTPRRPWRLVASRPDPTGNAVSIDWSVVGCTTGYRVNIVGTGVDRHMDIVGGTTSSTVIPDLPPSQSYSISVTSVGATADGGVSGQFHLHRSDAIARSELTIDFPDAGPTAPVAAAANGTGPWVNPELTWSAPSGARPDTFKVHVTGGGGFVDDKTVAGSATSTRLGDAVAAGTPYTVTVTPVMADGSEGKASRLSFGGRKAPAPEQVTGNAPVVQFSPVTDQQQGRVLGYEIGFGKASASKHVFVPAPTASDASAPWVAVDPSFAAVDAATNVLPLATMVAEVRTITTMGKSSWTSAQTITHTEVATPEASYFAGIGHVDGAKETVPRNGFLKVNGATADLQVTDMVWAQNHRQQSVPVTVSVYGPGTGAPAFTQEIAVTHLPDIAQDAWRASALPLPDGWTSVVLRRGGVDVATWKNTGGRACVASVTYTDVPTDLPQMWRDSWCAA